MYAAEQACLFRLFGHGAFVFQIPSRKNIPVGARHASPLRSSLRTPRVTRGQGMPCPYNVAGRNGVAIHAICKRGRWAEHGPAPSGPLAAMVYASAQFATRQCGTCLPRAAAYKAAEGPAAGGGLYSTTSTANDPAKRAVAPSVPRR